MQNHKIDFLLTYLKLLDIVIMLFALALSMTISMTIAIPSQEYDVSFSGLLQVKLKLINLLLLAFFSLIWHLIFVSAGLYESRRFEEGQGEWWQIGRAILIGSMLLLAVAVIFRRTHISQDIILYFTLLSCLLTCVSRTILRSVLGWLRRHNRNLRRLLFVGSNHRTLAFAERLKAQPELGYQVVGYIDDLLDHPSPDYARQQLDRSLGQLGSLQDFDEVVEREAIDEVVISLPLSSCYEQIQHLITACTCQGIQAHLLLDFLQVTMARLRATEFNGTPLLTATTGSLSLEAAAYWKRAFDVVIALILVIALAPIFLLIVVAVKLLSPEGPVFFVQTRVGYNRRRFKIIKFRTMIPDAECLQPQLEHLNEAQGPLFKIKNDPRITCIGRFLRKASLDELPQLFNVIKGDMSLVGPRPLPLRDVERFNDAWLKRRFSVKPGITCLWQINGRSTASFETWIGQDLEYIDQWSFGLDLKILARTIPSILRGTGAH